MIKSIIIMLMLILNAENSNIESNVYYVISDNQAEVVTSKDKIGEYAKENKVQCHSIGVSCTLRGCSDNYYDEEGNYHPAERCNTCTEKYICDDGKRFRYEFDSY